MQMTRVLSVDLEAGGGGIGDLKRLATAATAGLKVTEATNCALEIVRKKTCGDYGSVPAAPEGETEEEPAIVCRRVRGSQVRIAEPEPEAANEASDGQLGIRQRSPSASEALPEPASADESVGSRPVAQQRTLGALSAYQILSDSDDEAQTVAPPIVRQRTREPATVLLGCLHCKQSLDPTGSDGSKTAASGEADCAAQPRPDGCCPQALEDAKTTERAICATGEQDESTAPGTLWGAFVNLVVTCVGSTLVLVPSIVAELGVAGASLALLAPALLSAMTMRMLVHLADASVAGDYAGVMREFLGRGGDFLAFSGLIFLLPLAGATCLAFALELVPQMTASIGPGTAGLLVVAVAAPFACTSSLQRLGRASELALAGILYTMLLIAAQVFVTGAGHHVAVMPLRASSWNMVVIMLAQGLSAFGAEIAVIQSYLEVPKTKRVHFKRWVVDASLVTIFALYLAVGVLGYARYGSGVESNILLSLDDSAWAYVAKGAVLLGNVLRAPLFCVLFHVTLSSKFPEFFGRFRGRPLVRMALQCGCLALAGALSLALGSVGVLISIMGGTSAVLLCQVMPSIAWLVARRRGSVDKRVALDAGALFMAGVLPLYGVAFVTSLAMELARSP